MAPVISPDCVHVAGRGGAKEAVRDMYHYLSPTSHVMKSDVRSYCASIDKMLQFDALSLSIGNKVVLHMLWQYLKRIVCYEENYFDT